MQQPTQTRKPRRGKVLVLVGLTLTVLLAMVGLTVDSGLLQTARRRVQNAADAGALAAAMELLRGHRFEAAIAVATQVIQAQSGLGDRGPSITVRTPQTGAYAGKSNYVEVIVSAPQTVYLMPIVGVSPTQTVLGRAVAGVESNLSEGLVALDPGAIPGLAVRKNGLLSVNGAIIINSHGAGLDQYRNSVINDWPPTAATTSSTPSVQANLVQVHGGVDTPSNFTSFSGDGPNPIFAKAPIVANPLRDLPVPTLNDAKIQSIRPVRFPNENTTVGNLDPGVYEDISIGSGANVTFSPGIYILSPTRNGQGLSINGSPTVTANGAMFYLTGDDYLYPLRSNPTNPGMFDMADTPLDGPLPPSNAGFSAAPDPAASFASLSINVTGGKVDMTGLQDSSPFKGMLFYQRPRNKSDVSISGNAGQSLNLNGIVYAQWAALNLSGNGVYNAQFVVGTVNVSGNVTINANGKTFGLASQVFLVE